MFRSRVRIARVALASAGLLLASLAAHAFGTVNLLGQRAEHEKITRLALAGLGLGPRTLDEVAGRRGSFGAVGAADYRLIGEPSAHCDGADHLDIPGYPQDRATARARLEACRSWMMARLEEAVADAGALVAADGRIDDSQVPTLVACSYTGVKGRAKCNVLEDLGLALHVAEDFYSHSNWVDRPAPGAIGPDNPPGLGRTGRAPWLDPRRSEPFPDGLVTGCFEGVPEALHCTYGDGLVRVRHDVLNKDVGRIDAATGAVGAAGTARGRIEGNFRRAVEAAVEDARDKWVYFEERLAAVYGPARGRRIACVLRSDDPDDCRTT